MKTIRSIVAAFLLAILASGLVQAQTLHYTVDLQKTDAHKVHVTLLPQKLAAPTVTFQMPIWAPGAYSVTHYGHYVKDLKAFDISGKPLTVTAVNGDRWSIANARKLSRIEYDVLDSHKDSTSLYFAMANIDTSIFFANATALFGYVNDKKEVPATVTYQMPATWQLSTALDPATGAKGTPFHLTNFRAKNYDELADAPVMAAPSLQTRTFTSGPASYDVVLLSDKAFPMDSLAAYTKKIVEAETDFFHETPFKHYTFLIYAPTLLHLPSFAQGALEHANSSDYLLVNLPWPTFKTFGLSILSHEFFHLWNVKRIHSSLLGPFDYTSQVRTTSLWLSEGITDYYAHTLLSRYGIISPEGFLNDVRGWYEAGLQSPANKSLEQLSQEESDFNLENATTFYSKGPLVGMMLDIEIRSRTNNAKSLDDVMMALNNDAKHGKTFKDEDLIHRIEQIAGINLGDFYKHYIAGTDSLPLPSYLEKMGVLMNTGENTSNDDGLKLGLSPEGRITIAGIGSSSFLSKGGLRTGDVLDSLNGVKLTVDNIQQFSGQKDGETLHFTVIRDGKPIALAIPVEHIQAQESDSGPSISFAKTPTPLMLAIRKGIISAKS